MLTGLVVVVVVLAMAGLTYTLARGRRTLGSDEANEVYQELDARGGKHRRPPP